MVDRLLGVYMLDGAQRFAPSYGFGMFAVGAGINHKGYVIAYSDCNVCGCGSMPVNRDTDTNHYNPQCEECQKRYDSHPARQKYADVVARFNDTVDQRRRELARSIHAEYHFSTDGDLLTHGIPLHGSFNWEKLRDAVNKIKSVYDSINAYERASIESTYGDVSNEYVDLRWV